MLVTVICVRRKERRERHGHLRRPCRPLRALRDVDPRGGVRGRGRRRRRRRPRDQGRDDPRQRPRRRGAQGGDRGSGVRGRVTTTVEPEARVQLALEGMTCAACANRIERKLNRLEGVEASVNYATEQAAVRYDAGRVALADLLGAVEAAGYHARLAADEGEADDRAALLRLRLLVAAALTAPLTVLAMIPPLRFDGWEWAAFALATPVVLWAGSGFHRAALRNARHRSATMDTLVSIGTLAAWVWSIVALLVLDDADTYFEVAAVITTLILLGRYLEARARRRSSAAIRALLELGAKNARVLR